ncbi:Alpha-amylase [bacterium HR15]|nr:Alpha-amylase [bacterium HR15]
MMRPAIPKLLVGLSISVALSMAQAQLSWVGNTRLYITGVGQLPSRSGMLEPTQTLTITTQTYPIAPGQTVYAVITTDNWATTREFVFSFDYNTGNNTQWYLVLGPFPAGTYLQFYIRAQSSNGQTLYDNNGGQNYSLWVRYVPSFRDSPILQWFETDYRTIMQRLPEVVLAGYGALYLPSPVKSGGGGFSTGYNPYDHFDLGDRLQKGTVATNYGTTQELIELINLAHRLGLEVYCDLVVNHADNRASTAIDRYPGLIPEDFHIRSTADPTNNELDFNNAPPFGFGTLNYDVVGLADIAQEDGNNVRTGAFNLPAYASFNAWGKPSFVRHPLNPYYYPNGTPVAEDVRQYLRRWGWFLTSVIGFDGYRIDAARHVPPAFFAKVPNQPGGGTVSVGDFLPYLYGLKPSLYIFGEVYSGDSYELREYAKTGMNLLDFPMKFMASNLFNANGYGDIGASLSNPLGTDGSTGLPYELGGLARYLGVGFVQSHDEGPPTSNNLAYAWLLTRPGRPKVYYDGNNIAPNDWSHFPKPGRYNALGNGDDSLLHLLNVRKCFARGELVNRFVSSDLYIYERQVNGSTLLLVGLNDRSDVPLTASVQTAFPPGTVLLDYSGQRPPVVVGAGGGVTITVPPNSAPGAPNNGYGYVLYAPQIPRPLAGERVIRLFDAQGNSIPFETIPTPGGAYASGRSFEAATLTLPAQNPLTIMARTDSSGVQAYLKLDNGLPVTGRTPLQNTPEGLTDGFIPMDRVANGTFELRGVDLSGLPAGLHVLRVRVFADTGPRPPLFNEFIAFFYLKRMEQGIVVDGDLQEYGEPLVLQTRTPSSDLNRLDALYVRNDHRYLYIGIAGRVDTAENLANGVALFIDVDYGAGTGIRTLEVLNDDSGPAPRLLSNQRITAPAGFGAEFGVGVFRHSALHSAPEALFTGDAVRPPVVGAQAGCYRLDGSQLNWLPAEPCRIVWRPRLNPSDPPTGLEMALPLDALYRDRKANRPIGLFAVLLNTGESGAVFSAYDSRRDTFGPRPPVVSWLSNQFLPPQPNIVTNPGAVPITIQAIATYTLQIMPRVETPHRILLGAMRYDPVSRTYRLSGRVVNASDQPIHGPIALWMRLPNGAELVNRTGNSLMEAGAAYLILQEGDLPPGGVALFELRFRATSPRGLPPKLELHAGMGAL